jgi:GR25 family glycosyltransferase involved in LPS biosynthesis
MDSLNVDKIYIIHYDQNIDRKQYIKDYFSHYKNDIEFCSFPNRKELTDDLIKIYYHYDKNELVSRTSKFNRPIYTPLIENEIATAICHFEVFKKAIKEINNNCLILEDDIIFRDNFNQFNYFLSQTPNDYDCVFIGDGAFMHHNDINQNQTSYLRSTNVTRCSDSIIYKKSCLENILNNYFYFTQPIDWELELILLELQSKVYWWEPTLVSQGSQYGVYQSNIR